jgi:hypothetical protein
VEDGQRQCGEITDADPIVVRVYRSPINLQQPVVVRVDRDREVTSPLSSGVSVKVMDFRIWARDAAIVISLPGLLWATSGSD